MKKKLTRIFSVILLLNCFSISLFAAPANPYSQYAPCGIPLQDAIGVNVLLQKNATDVPARQMLISILQQYTNTPIDSATDLGVVFKDNPYLRMVFEGKKIKTVLTGAESFKSTETAVINGTGGLATGLASPTTAIDAIGTFISTRFKEEINIAFLNKFRGTIKGDINFTTLFPKTTLLLTTTEPYNYTSFLKSLSEDFSADFKSMPENLPELMKKRVPKDKRTDAFYLFLVYADVLSSFENGATPPQIIDRISTNTYIDSLSNVDMRSAFQLSGLISRSIASRTGDRFWSPMAQVQLLAQPFNTQLRQLFLGFMYAKESSLFTQIKFNNKTLNDIVGTADALMITFCNYINEIDKQFEVTQQFLFSLKNKLNNITVEDITRYAKSFIDIAKVSFNIQAWTGTPLTDFTVIREKYLPPVYMVIDLWDAIEAKQYGVALTCVISFSKEFIPADSVWQENLTKYGTFMVNMINAKTSDEMVAALEGAALPVGSYRMKRNSYGNISLNAYGGVLLGGLSSENKFHFGFTAPVGLVFSHGWRSSKPRHSDKDGSSISLFFPIIDVGAVTAFRLQNSKAVLPEMAWQDIFSPGAYVIFGFRNSPLSFQAGTQYGPALRKIDDQTNAVIAIPGWTLNFGLTVDIPLLNFYTRVEK